MVSFVTQSIEGVDLTALYTSYDQTAAVTATNSPDNPGPPFKVGTEVVCTDGSIWLFVKFTAGVNQYDVVMIDPATTGAVQILGGGTAEVTKKRIGFYQNSTAAVANNFGWVMVSGVPTINVLGSCAKAVQLYTTDTSGKLDDAIATGSQYPVRNVFLTTTISSTTASSNTAQAAYPTAGPLSALL
jgi:hypothetical protein